MTLRKALLWIGIAIFCVLIVAAISTPNLLRSRTAADYSRMQRVDSLDKDSSAPRVARVAGFVSSDASRQPATDAPPLDRKLIRNAELALEVADIRAAVENIQRLAEQDGGEVDKLELSDSGAYSTATMVVRVPAHGLNDALSSIKGFATRTLREQVNARDVTREFYDNEAHLRNLHAEEQQYLAILKQAGTIKDTLAVAQQLSDVRDRIERLQAQIQVMSRDVELSEVSITLQKRADATVLGFHWRPFYNARVATHEMLSGLGEWADWLVAVLIKLPLVLAWILSIGGFLFVFGKTLAWGWKRVRPALDQEIKL